MPHVGRGGYGMELVLELFGTLLVILGIGAGVWAIATGHIYGTFKAAAENPLFALAAIAGILFVVAGLILGNLSLSGAVHNFENGVGWVLTIGGILLVVALVVGITQDRLRPHARPGLQRSRAVSRRRASRTSRKAATLPTSCNQVGARTPRCAAWPLNHPSSPGARARAHLPPTGFGELTRSDARGRRRRVA
jgi:hypothetical protein